MSSTLPLCVDLDGTLVQTDTLHEQTLRLLQARPTAAFQLPGWLSGGRSGLKRRIAGEVSLDAATLPYRGDFLQWLRDERAAGRSLILATAADQSIADGVAQHLDLFDEVIGSDGATNLKGQAKADALVDRFGVGGFAYAGDSACDLAVWRQAGAAVLVDPPAAVEREVQQDKIERRFGRPKGRARALLKAMRVYQWVKNGLVFLPMIMGHAYGAATVTAAALIFVAFSLTASGIYLLNDLLDLDADRAHPRKRRRPFASGDLPLSYGIASPILVLIGLLIASTVNVGSVAVLLVYAGTTTAYSTRLKTLPVVDVFVLAGLYTVRVLAGGVATNIVVSVWLLAFSSFLFLSLAFLKRTGELLAMVADGRDETSRRGYRAGDVGLVESMGVASAFIAVLVLSLYVDTDMASSMYVAPRILWFLVPLVLFWLCRMWFAAIRGQMTDDPIVYAAKEPGSWVVFALCAVVFGMAVMGPF